MRPSAELEEEDEMNADRITFELLADALEYPNGGSGAAAREAAHRLSECCPELAAPLAELAGWLAEHGPEEAEERYTLLFDLSPVCTLHAGYHVFGEAYQRGELLAGLVGELREAGVDPGTELPDYFPTLLRLLPRLSEESRQELCADLLLPALARMEKPLANTPHSWGRVVAALAPLLRPLCGDLPVAEIPDFEQALCPPGCGAANRPDPLRSMPTVAGGARC
jgi:nitrate reductase molybdenum cofactor assembly chaperone